MNSNRIIPRSTSLILLLLSVSFSSLWAQTGTIKGLVTDNNQQALSDINLSLEGTHYGAATEADGHYQIIKVPTGSYTLVASGIGFQTQKKQVTVESGQTYTINFTLPPASEQLREVLVEGDAIPSPLTWSHHRTGGAYPEHYGMPVCLSSRDLRLGTARHLLCR